MQPKQKLLKKSIEFFILLCGVIFIIPNKFKAYPIIILILLSVLFSLKNKAIQFPTRKILLLSLFFFICLFTSFFSVDWGESIRKLTALVSILILPIIFGNLSSRNFDFSPILLKKLTFVLLSSLCCFIFITFIYFYPRYNNLSTTIIHYSNLINIDLGLFSIHPIYLSMFIGVSILLIIDYMPESSFLYEKIFLVSIVIFFLIILSILFRKGPIIFLFISITLYFKSLYSIKNVIFSLIIFIAIIFVSIQFIPKYKNINRFEELLHISEQTKITEENSTEIRKSILLCSIDIFLENPYFGTGIGDLQKLLNPCLNEKGIDTTIKTYNTHNQYISVLLISGIFGLLIFIFSLYKIYSFKNIYNNPLAFAIFSFFLLNFLTENILERENGVITYSFYMSIFLFNEIKNASKKVNQLI